jgi:hypothetical protein
VNSTEPPTAQIGVLGPVPVGRGDRPVRLPAGRIRICRDAIVGCALDGHGVRLSDGGSSVCRYR